MNSANRERLRRFSVIFFWLAFLALAALFFTNDFGLVDIHKTSLIVAVGIDTTENEVQVTAQLAVPKPSQSGDNVEYAEIQGSGETVADALNEINAKTGFYPQLQFCKLILLGDSCKDKNIFRVMGCFFRKNYSELTAFVAMCNGKASEYLAMPTKTGDMTTTVIQRALADELKKTANVAGVNLKDIAVAHFSPSAACYMPIIEANVQGTSEQGGNGDNVGGDKPQQGASGGEGGANSGGQGGESGGESGGGQGGESQSGQGGGQQPVEFTARQTAIFREGMFAGTLNEQQSFALNILKNEIRLAVLPCDTPEYHYTLGLGLGKGGIKVGVQNGKVQVKLGFKAAAQIAGIKKEVEPKETTNDDKLSPEVLKAAEEEVERRLMSMIEVSRQTDCDFLGIKQKLFKFHYGDYQKLADTALREMEVGVELEIRSRK